MEPSPPPSPTGESADPLLRALHLLGREISHEINNVTSVLRGTVFLAGEAQSAGSGADLVRDVELACDRLELLADQLLLGDPGMGAAGETCDAALVARESVALMRAVLDVPIGLEGEADGLACGLAAGTLRAALCKVIGIFARKASPGSEIVLSCRRDGGAVAIRVAGAVDPAALDLRDPRAALGLASGPMARLGITLWHVARGLEFHGGGFAIEAGSQGAVARLLLPPA